MRLSSMKAIVILTNKDIKTYRTSEKKEKKEKKKCVTYFT